jgi:hypothetical protein
MFAVTSMLAADPERDPAGAAAKLRRLSSIRIAAAWHSSAPVGQRNVCFEWKAGIRSTRAGYPALINLNWSVLMNSRAGLDLAKYTHFMANH